MISASSFISGSDQNICEPICCSCESACGKVFFGAELLYWRAYEGGLSNPCDNIEITNSTEDDFTVSRLKGKNHHPNFNWDLGFRVGIGYQFANSNFDIAAYWTRYNSHSSGGKNEHRHKWNLDYDEVDLFFSYECNPSGCLIVTPYAILRYAEIDQHLRKHLMYTTDEVKEKSLLRLREDFWGVGPLLGLEVYGNVGCGFSIYGNVAVGILYGNFHVNSHNKTKFDTGVNFDHLRNHTDAAEPVLDVGFGVQWETSFCHCKNIIFQLGLEEYRYFNHNQFCGYGDLSLTGINFAAVIEF